MPNIERNTPMAPGDLTPAAAFSPAAGAVRPAPAAPQSFPQSTASSALGSRPKPSSIAFPNSAALPARKHAFTATPQPVIREQPRDVAAESWRDRAGPWFEERDYERMLQTTRGSEFRFRSDQYDSDSDASDLDDIPASEAGDLDPEARAGRFRRDTAALLDRHEDILSAYRQAPFTQSAFLKDLAPGSEGACLALSVSWLQAAEADPQQPMAERIGSITSGPEAQRVLEMQRQSDKLHLELPFRTYHPLKELSETSKYLEGVQFGKYVTCKAGPGETLSDMGTQAALRLQHEDAARHNVLIPTPGAHAIACEKLDDGRFRLFEPNHGAYEVAADKLNELLAAVLAKHLGLVKRQEDRWRKDGVPIASLIEKTELRIVPIHIAPARTDR